MQDFLIRKLEKKDIKPILKRFQFSWATPEKTQEIWETNFLEQQENIRTVGVIEKKRGDCGLWKFASKIGIPPVC